MSGELQKFIAVFRLRESGLSVDKFINTLLSEVEQKNSIPKAIWNSENSQLYQLYIQIRKVYETLITKLNAAGRVVVVNLGSEQAGGERRGLG